MRRHYWHNPTLASGRCGHANTKFNAAAGLAHPSKAIAAMSKKPKAAAAI